MKKRSLRSLSLTFLSLSALLLALTLSPVSPGASARQQSGASPTTLLRFRVSNSNRGYMLTGIPERGYNLGYVNEGSLYDPQVADSGTSSGIVHPPAPYYTPAPGEPLVPLYQWRVVQGGRTSYYYSTIIHSVGSNYYFEGLVGYVLPVSYNPQQHMKKVASVPINYYYSQQYGFWYTVRRPETEIGFSCFPDTCNKSATSYRFQGSGFRLITWSNNEPFCFPPYGSCPPFFVFDPPPPPPPPPVCDPNDEWYCNNSGGWWDWESCSCNYWGQGEASRE